MWAHPPLSEHSDIFLQRYVLDQPSIHGGKHRGQGGLGITRTLRGVVPWSQPTHGGRFVYAQLFKVSDFYAVSHALPSPKPTQDERVSCSLESSLSKSLGGAQESDSEEKSSSDFWMQMAKLIPCLGLLPKPLPYRGHTTRNDDGSRPGSTVPEGPLGWLTETDILASLKWTVHSWSPCFPWDAKASVLLMSCSDEWSGFQAER